MTEQFHKVEDVAPSVGLSKSALYDACRKNQFPHVRIGKRIRIPASALAKWVEEQTSRNTKAQTQGESLAAVA